MVLNGFLITFYLYVHITIKVLRKYIINSVSFEVVKKAETMGTFGDQKCVETWEVGNQNQKPKDR